MQNFINYFGHTIKNQNAFYFYGGDVPISFVDARDIAMVAVKIPSFTEDQYTYTNKPINVTGQETLSYTQAAEILSKELRKISYTDISEDDARNGMKQNGVNDWLIDVIINSLNYINRGEYGSQISEAIEQITGRKPAVFEQFVRDYIRYFRLKKEIEKKE